MNKTSIITSINGRLVDSDKACISVNTESYLFGLSVFETMRTYHKKIFCLNEHLKRLYDSADIIGLQSIWEFDKVYRLVLDILKENKNWKELRIRVILTKDDLIIMMEEIQEKSKIMYKNGVKCSSFCGRRHFPRAKKLSDLFLYRAKKYAVSSGAYDSILIDEQSYVSECAYANLFWVKNGMLYTRSDEILFGITREMVLGLVEKCHFEKIQLKSLMNADEVFLTQSTSGILPIVEIDGNKIADGNPGLLTKKLMKDFDDLVNA